MQLNEELPLPSNSQNETATTNKQENPETKE